MSLVSGGEQMLVWAALPILVLAVLASGPFRDNIPPAVEPLAQLAAVLSLFILVCAVEAGGRNKDSGG
jgi:predicted permease